MVDCACRTWYLTHIMNNTGTYIDEILGSEVCRLLDCLAALMKVRAVFYSADGRVLKRGGDVGNCDYCVAYQRIHGASACHAEDRRRREETAASGRALRYTCHAGLGEIVAPVVVDGETAGFIVLGQFRTSVNMPPSASGDEALERAFDEVSPISPDDVDRLVEMLGMLVDYVVSRELVRLPGDRRLRRLRDYIRRRLPDVPSLADAASHLACSESSLTHYLRSRHSTCFKEQLEEIRLDVARQLLHDSPELSISEVAQRSGYGDPHYFGRVFRRHFGTTPGAIRGPRC
ncbi:MAG: PocR ligand-binding domain-containing protein [Victivallaceae bacterium]|nr:PocR ligand-binding domain-containing protein [Victivallaceae bacterium]